jgi:indolepyruvate decarboxylase
VAEVLNSHTEDTVVELVPLASCAHARAREQISSALVIAALCWFEIRAGVRDRGARREAGDDALRVPGRLPAADRRAAHFRLPGDMVLGLFQSLGRDNALEIITLSHEPGVGFAADGYARATRRLGVICVTYGAGGCNVLNPVAGAYAERVPLLVISGGPGSDESRMFRVHHQVKSVETQQRVFSEVTCDARILHRADIAAEEIHELVSNARRELRPAYLEIHRDQVDMEIPVPESIRSWDGSLPRPSSDPRRLEEALRDTVTRLRAADKPLLVGGADLYRVGAEKDFLRLAEKLGTAVTTTVLGKGVFPMDHPLHLGIHRGPMGVPAIQKRAAEAGLVIELGTQHTDMNLGRAASLAPLERSIWAEPERVAVSFTTTPA